MAKVVVTGGAGFIGSHLSAALTGRGHDVHVIDDLRRGREIYLRSLIDQGRVTLHRIDIRDAAAVARVMEGATNVFHQAAMSINHGVKHPEEAFSIGIDGTFTVFKAAKEAGVKRVVYASSASVYGDPLYVPMDEEHPKNPITPYCVSKYATEKIARMSMFKGMTTAGLRYFNVYGPRQSTDAFYTSVILTFTKRILAGQPPLITGDGSQSMDFVHVRDIVGANLAAMDGATDGEVYNVATGTSTSVKDVAQTLLKLLASDLEPQFVEGSVPMVRRRQASIAKIERDLGWRPRIQFHEGLQEIVHDIRAHPELY